MAKISPEMNKLWTDRPNKEWKLGGIYADKPGYHNSVNTNMARWPMNYSVKKPLDLVSYNRDDARAIDLTMSESEMIKWTSRMKKSALDPADHRLAAVREFYGTLDGKTVYGLIKDSENGEWKRSTADDTHLWHGHMSVFTAFTRDWKKLSPILSVWRGESLAESVVNDMLPKRGDTGQEVYFWQNVHNQVRGVFNPPLAQLQLDGDYGPAMQAAVYDFFVKRGGKGAYKGEYIAGWVAMQYFQAWMEKIAKNNLPNPTPPLIDPTVLKPIVEDWLNKNFTNSVQIEGTLKGNLTHARNL